MDSLSAECSDIQAMHADDIFQLAQSIYDADGVGDVRTHSHVFAQKVGAASIAYILHRPPGHRRIIKEGVHHFTTHNADWLNAYASEKLWLSDPVLREIPTRTQPFRWSELYGRDLTKTERTSLHSLQEFGLSDGIAAPSRGPYDGEANFALAFDAGKPLSPSDLKAIRPAIAMISAAVHDRMIGLAGLMADPDNAPRLTPSEREILTWCARGKTSADIATILSVHDSYVRRVLMNIRNKLDVVTTAQAVVKSITLRLISP